MSQPLGQLALWAFLLLVSVTGTTPAAATRKIVLQEHLGKTWTNERVSFPFAAGKGDCLPNGLELAGPQGPVPAQLSQVVYWPDGKTVKTATLSFIASLAPLATDTYKIKTGRQAVTAPITDLQVTAGQDRVDIVTSKYGIRLLLGEQTYASPVPAADVPGPVLAMRLPDGVTWFGGSRLYGTKKIAGYRSVITGAGPVSGEVTIQYRYEDGTLLELTANLCAGDVQALWEMKVTPPRPTDTSAQLLGPGFNEGQKVAEETMARDGWQLLLSPGLDPVFFIFFPEFGEELWSKMWYDGWWHADPFPVPIEKEKPGTILYLVPWEIWSEGRSKTSITFRTEAKGEIMRIGRRDAGVWVEPAAPATWASYGNPRMRDKWVYLIRGTDVPAYLQFSAATGLRRWEMGLPRAKTDTGANTMTAAPPGGIGHELDRIKDLVLTWSGDKGKHPRIYFSAKDVQRQRRGPPPDPELLAALQKATLRFERERAPSYGDSEALTAYLLTGSPEVARDTRMLERFRLALSKLGEYDTMRTASLVCCYYDALIDDPLLEPAERRMLQAQFAYLGYHLADPTLWSMERGYASGNLNMTVANVLNQGILACTIPEHPMAREWAAPALAMMEKWLSENVGPAGEWQAPGESVSNYAPVSVSMLVTFAIAARNAGLHDYVDDPRMKKLLLFLAKQFTPPDPRPYQGRAKPIIGTPGSGRGPARNAHGLNGLMARATAKSDPAYSQVQQWIWLRTGQSSGYVSDRMSGMERLYFDPALPAAVPDWTMDVFPCRGAIMRQGVGTPLEYSINFLFEPVPMTASAAESGGFPAIFAKGVPVSVRFPGDGYQEREELLISRVLPAREAGDTAARENSFGHLGPMKLGTWSDLPRQAYITADFRMERPEKLHYEKLVPLPKWPAISRLATALPVDWKRQILFLRDTDAAGVNYLLLRDTVTGGQPTMWHMWTLSEMIIPADPAADLPALLAAKPGNRLVDAQELQGDRFTAIGQFGVDVEYYIAAPAATPRHTLRCGAAFNTTYVDYQDLLHVQMPGDGAYFVAFYPRLRGEAAPTFASLAEGRIIQVTGTWGTDYGFLAAAATEATAAGAAFQGTAGSVQARTSGTVLSLAAPGSVSYQGYTLAADGAASLHLSDSELVIDGSPAPAEATDRHATTVTLTAPGVWSVAKSSAKVALTRLDNGSCRLILPASARRIVLVKR